MWIEGGTNELPAMKKVVMIIRLGAKGAVIIDFLIGDIALGVRVSIYVFHIGYLGIYRHAWPGVVSSSSGVTE